ncbi:MAG: GlcG/HbpS family heme-binding protein [Halothiobacillaceae bacterium]
MKNMHVLVGLMAALIAGPVIAEPKLVAPPAIDVRQLHPDAALFAAQKAQAACREAGYHTTTVSVVDRRQGELVMLRDVAAPRITMEVARAKAYTANQFSAPTSALTDFHDGPLALRDNVFLDAGGVPIESGGTIYGAIGVAGAPTQPEDEACARAGAEALAFELDMM